MLIVKGVQRKSGEFQGNKYDNIVLHCLNDNPSTPTICGGACEMVKIKSHLVSEVFSGLVNNDADFRDLMEQPIQVFYDRFGNALQINLIGKGGK